jgi:MFS transporter, SP family, arabinose:H+ symporter
MKLKFYLLGSTLVAAVAGFLFGFDTVVISGANKMLTIHFDLTPAKLGLTVASALVGTVIGSLAAGKPAEWLGRKPVLAFLAVLYVASALGCAFAGTWAVLLTFRLIGGLAIGGASVVAPLYIAEISPPQIRGRLVAVNQLNIVIGLVVAYLSNYIIGVCMPDDPYVWRWMLGIVAVPSALFFLFVLPIPESPRWLAKRHRRDEALAVLKKLGNEDAEAVLKDITESLHEETVAANEPFFRAKYLRPILLAVMVATFNQLSGINAILYYSNNIFAMAAGEKVETHEEAKADAHAKMPLKTEAERLEAERLVLEKDADKTRSESMQSIVIGLTNLVFTIVGMSIIDHFGRRKLLLVGAAGLTVCLSVTAGAFFMNDHIAAQAAAGALSSAQAAAQQLLIGKIVLGGLIGFIAFFAFSSGAVIWVFIAEIFPNRVRARGQALGSFTHWFWCMLLNLYFPLIAGYSTGAPFLFFAAMMALQWILVFKFLPETKRVSLEDMQRHLGIE